MNALKQKILHHIAAHGGISVAEFMAACLYDPQYGYYATRPAIGGADADFITAPQASQMFGELIGLWCVHEWDVLGRPSPVALIEFGPGSGALMSDAWRAARVEPAFRDAVGINLVENSQPLKALQAQALHKVGARALWVDDIVGLAPAPTLAIANEFLDCLPIQQFVRVSDGWRERLIGPPIAPPIASQIAPLGDTLAFTLSDRRIPNTDGRIPPTLFDAGVGAIAEHAAGLTAWVDTIAARLKRAPGRVLVVDYAGNGEGDTLQAIQAHKKVDPLAAPGEADLTARVDYVQLKVLARASGLDVAGPVDQGDFLRALGIEARTEGLSKAHPERASRIARELHRLTHADQMGTLFKVLCLSSPNLPKPAGF